MDKLNNRHRKRLEFKILNEAFFGIKLTVVLAVHDFSFNGIA